MKFSVLQYISFALIACGLFSCSSVKYIPDSEYLLDKVHLQSDNPDYNYFDLTTYIRQLPNYKMFGLNKTQLQLYNLSGKDSSKWINRQLKKAGEPPVIFDSALVDKTNLELRKLFVNKGYMDVNVSSNIQLKEKKAEVTYIIKSNEPYRIKEYTVDIQDSAIHNILYEYGSEIQKIPGEKLALHQQLVKNGMLFDRNQLDAERNRITGFLRNRGYYAFENDYISYEADSLSNDHSVKLKLQLHPYPEILSSGTFVEVPHRKYYFNKVFYFLDYDPLKLAGTANYQKTDSVIRDNQTIYFQGKSPSIRPSVLINNNFLISGKAYAQVQEDATYAAYSSLQALNNVNIHFEEITRNDSSLLDCYILTMPARKQTTTYSIEGTNTAGDFGLASSLVYSHRNLFRGSETFNFRIRGAYEAISHFKNPYLELGTEASIRLPKFMFPFLSSDFKNRMRTSTEFSLSYNYQTRPEYVRTLLSGGFRYIWQRRGSGTAQHQFDLLNIDYVYLPTMDSTFKADLPISAKLFGYTDQFIVGMRYFFTHSTLDPSQKQRNAHSLRLSVESAGNALFAANSLLGSKKDARGTYELFGTYYSQFLKGDIDYSKTIVVDKNNSIAWRIGGGIGVPYGNASILPFERRYYSGGANSVRAWSVRELGPGAYHPTDSTSFYEQSGDIKLDMNIEYRTRFFWKFEAAAFIDAGNIWTIRNYEKQEGGVFKLNSFYKQIAVGYGLGLRLDFDFFLIRFDGGLKAYNPEKEGKDRWAILKPNLGNNFAWHIAVGYPF